MFWMFNLFQPDPDRDKFQHTNKKDHFDQYPFYNSSYVSRFNESCFVYKPFFKKYSVFCFRENKSTSIQSGSSNFKIDTNFKTIREKSEKSIPKDSFEIEVNSSIKPIPTEFTIKGNLNSGNIILTKYKFTIIDTIIQFDTSTYYLNDKEFTKKLKSINFEKLGSIDVSELFLDPTYFKIHINQNGSTYKSRMIYLNHKNVEFNNLYLQTKELESRF